MVVNVGGAKIPSTSESTMHKPHAVFVSILVPVAACLTLVSHSPGQLQTRWAKEVTPASAAGGAAAAASTASATAEAAALPAPVCFSSPLGAFTAVEPLLFDAARDGRLGFASAKSVLAVRVAVARALRSRR